MATTFTITNNVTEITGLTDGTTYAIQNQSYQPVYINDASADEPTDGFIVLNAFEFLYIKKLSGMKVWGYSHRPSAKIAYGVAI